jgi:hypothetical protein
VLFHPLRFPTRPLTALLLLAACRHEPRAAPAMPPPEVRAAAWPDPVAKVGGEAIPRHEIVGDLQAAVRGGILAETADDLTLLRAAATALEARIDAAVVAKAVPSDAAERVTRATTAALAAEMARAGGRDGWLLSTARRGENEAMRLRALSQEAGLDALAAGQLPPVSDAELHERFEHQTHMLLSPASVRVREVAEPLPPMPTTAQVTAAEAALARQVHTDKLDAPERGWQTRRELGPERWTAVQTLQVGQLSAVVRSPFGLHRLQVIEKRPERPATFAEAKPRLLAYVARMHRVQADAVRLAALRREAHIERFAPFDHPPGGLPLTGSVTVSAFEEDDD